MPENNSFQVNPSPNSPADFGTVPQHAETFGNIPQSSESFGTVPNGSESFRNIPKFSERKENHTLTVREVARMFETAGVARTERSITNWCQKNKMGVARLDAYFDPNDLKWFITPQSVELAIQEELARAAKVSESASESFGMVPKPEVKQPEPKPQPSESEQKTIEAMEFKIRDLEITNRVKDKQIQILENHNKEFANERQGYIEKLMSSVRKVGQLESKLINLLGRGKMENEVESENTKMEQFHI